MRDYKDSVLGPIEKELKQRKVKTWEIFFVNSKSLSIEAKNQEIDGLKASSDTGVSLRVLIDGHLGFSYTTDFAPQSLETLIESAIGSAKTSDPDPAYCFASKPDLDYPDCEIFDPEFSQRDQDEKIKRALMLEKAALDKDPAIRQVRRATYSESESEIVILNSEGLFGSYRSTAASAVIMAMAVRDDMAEMGWDFDFCRFYNKINVTEVGKRAAQKALRKLGGKPVQTQRAPIILNEETMAELLEVLAPSFHGDNAVKGKSLLAGRLDDKVFSDQINIFDDGLYPHGLGTAPFDAEGTPSQTTCLVEKGTLKNYLYDLYWAKRSGRKTTGNASRGSYKSPPGIGNNNYYMVGENTKSKDELIKSVSKGLFVHELIGVHTANPISGEFSLGATGLWIENGDIKYPVKGITISGNLIEILNQIGDIGNEVKFFGTTGAPAVLIEDIQISGT